MCGKNDRFHCRFFRNSRSKRSCPFSIWFCNQFVFRAAGQRKLKARARRHVSAQHDERQPANVCLLFVSVEQSTSWMTSITNIRFGYLFHCDSINCTVLYTRNFSISIKTWTTNPSTHELIFQAIVLIIIVSLQSVNVSQRVNPLKRKTLIFLVYAIPGSEFSRILGEFSKNLQWKFGYKNPF